MIMLDKVDFDPDPKYQALLRYQKAVRELLALRYRDGECDAAALHSFACEVEEIEEMLTNEDHGSWSEPVPEHTDADAPQEWQGLTRPDGEGTRRQCGLGPTEVTVPRPILDVLPVTQLKGSYSVPLCLECEQPATWIRHTQFSGDHPFCEVHAQKEKDFGKENPSYFVWRRVGETS
jgi:hypothetical protein